MEILLWWLPPAIVTGVAMLWVTWLGRARDVSPDRSDAAQERFAAAILRDLPAQVTRQVGQPRPARERSTGIAVRPSQAPRPVDEHVVLTDGIEGSSVEADYAATHDAAADAARDASRRTA